MLKVSKDVHLLDRRDNVTQFYYQTNFTPLLYQQQLLLQMRGGGCRLDVELESLSRRVGSGFISFFASSELADLVSMFSSLCDRKLLTIIQSAKSNF